MWQVSAQVYPSVLITSGLHDPRVAYWEPAKWAQHLREKRTNRPGDGHDVLVKMDLSAGHFSASDRYKYLSELAFDYAWLLDTLKLADTQVSTEEAPQSCSAAAGKATAVGPPAVPI